MNNNNVNLKTSFLQSYNLSQNSTTLQPSRLSASAAPYIPRVISSSSNSSSLVAKASLTVLTENATPPPSLTPSSQNSTSMPSKSFCTISKVSPLKDCKESKIFQMIGISIFKSTSTQGTAFIDIPYIENDPDPTTTLIDFLYEHSKFNEMLTNQLCILSTTEKRFTEMRYQYTLSFRGHEIGKDSGSTLIQAQNNAARTALKNLADNIRLISQKAFEYLNETEMKQEDAETSTVNLENNSSFRPTPKPSKKLKISFLGSQFLSASLNRKILSQSLKMKNETHQEITPFYTAESAFLPVECLDMERLNKIEGIGIDLVKLDHEGAQRGDYFKGFFWDWLDPDIFCSSQPPSGNKIFFDPSILTNENTKLYGIFPSLTKIDDPFITPIEYNRCILIECQTNRAKKTNGLDYIQYYFGGEVSIWIEEIPPLNKKIERGIRLLQFNSSGPFKINILKCMHTVLDKRRKYHIVCPPGMKLHYEIWEMESYNERRENGKIFPNHAN